MEKISKLKNISIKKFLETEYGCDFVKQGSSWFCLSPLRAENNPSFAVNLREDLWYDFGIGEGGDIIKLIQQIENCSFSEAIKILQNYDTHENFIVTPPHKNQKESWDISSFYQSISKYADQLLIRRFFKEINLPFHYEAGIAEYQDKKGQRYIAIPCPHKRDVKSLECIGVTVSSGTVKFSTYQDKKIRKTLGKKYPWVLLKTEKALIAESIIDCLAGETIYGNGLTLISLNGVGNVKFLPEILHAYNIEQVLLALDNDEAGRHAMQKAMEIIPSHIEIRIIKDHIKSSTKDLYKHLISLRKKEAKNVSRIN